MDLIEVDRGLGIFEISRIDVVDIAILYSNFFVVPGGGVLERIKESRVLRADKSACLHIFLSSIH